MVPTGPKSSVPQSRLPSGRATFLTETERVLKPPQPLNFVSSAVPRPLGVRPVKSGPLCAARRVPPVCQPAGVGDGGSVTDIEYAPVAVAPAESVTVTKNVCVPLVVGE